MADFTTPPRPLLAASLLLFASAGQAATLAYVTPHAVVGPNDPIEVWVRLSTDVDIVFDGTATDPEDYAHLYTDLPPWIDPWPDLFGEYVPEANGGEGAFVRFEGIYNAYTNNSRTCNGTFADLPPCGSSNYTFTFNHYPDPDAFSFRDSFTLLAGESRDFHVGTFFPKDGGAAPGLYTFAGITLTFSFSGYGTDDLGVTHEMYGVWPADLAATCGQISDPGCVFSREVIAPVPIPATGWLLLSAAGALGAFSGRRRLAGMRRS